MDEIKENVFVVQNQYLLVLEPAKRGIPWNPRNSRNPPYIRHCNTVGHYAEATQNHGRFLSYMAVHLPVHFTHNIAIFVQLLLKLCVIFIASCIDSGHVMFHFSAEYYVCAVCQRLYRTIALLFYPVIGS